VGEINHEEAIEMGCSPWKIYIDYYGINHIRTRHGQQIGIFSDTGIINYVKGILCNKTHYDNEVEGTLKLIWVKNQNADLVIVGEVRLEENDGFYRVKTAFKSKPKRFKNKKVIMCGKNSNN